MELGLGRRNSASSDRHLEHQHELNKKIEYQQRIIDAQRRTVEANEEALKAERRIIEALDEEVEARDRDNQRHRAELESMSARVKAAESLVGARRMD